MASMDESPKDVPIPTQIAALVTSHTLGWCTSLQDPCLPLKFLTLYPTDINTNVLSLLIHPPHKYLKNLDWLKKPQEYCKFHSLLTWLGDNHSAPLKVPPYRNFLNLEGACICNTWYISDGRTIDHVGQSSATTTPIWREPPRSGSN